MPQPDKQAIIHNQFNFHPHQCRWDTRRMAIHSWWHNVNIRLGNDVDCSIKGP